jgi:hypothetical protein
MLINRGEDPDKASEEELTQLFQKHLSQVMRWIESQPNVHYLGVSYNYLLQDPEPFVAQINKFLGGNLYLEAMAAVVDPGLYRQRKSES